MGVVGFDAGCFLILLEVLDVRWICAFDFDCYFVLVAFLVRDLCVLICDLVCTAFCLVLAVAC